MFQGTEKETLEVKENERFSHVNVGGGMGMTGMWAVATLIRTFVPH